MIDVYGVGLDEERGGQGEGSEEQAGQRGGAGEWMDHREYASYNISIQLDPIEHFAATGDESAALNAMLGCFKCGSGIDDIMACINIWDNVAERAFLGLNIATLLLVKRRPHHARDILGHMIQHIRLLSKVLATRVCLMYVQVVCQIISRDGVRTTAAESDMHVVLNHLQDSSDDSEQWIRISPPDENSQTIANAIAKLSILHKHMICCRYYLLVKSLRNAEKELVDAQGIFATAISPLLIRKGVLRAAYISLRNIFIVRPLEEVQSEVEICTRYKCDLAAMQRDYRESLLHMQLTPDESNPDFVDLSGERTAEHYNNAGCVALQLDRLGAALLFFRKGLLLFESTSTQRRHGVHCEFSVSTCTALIYNCGLTLLKLNQPLGAFKCFERVAKCLQRQPTFWLRLAECCIYHDVNSRSKDDLKQKSPIHSFVSSGLFRRLIMRRYEYSGNGCDQASSRKYFQCTLSRAIQYASNALLLIKINHNGEALASGRKVDSTEEGRSAASALEIHVHLVLSYLHLSLGDWVRTLSHVEFILTLGQSEDHIRFIAESYAVEALCSLGDVDSALQYLDVCLLSAPEKCVESQNVLHSWGTDGSPPFSISEAPAVIRSLNIAIVKTYQGYLDEAESGLRNILDSHPKFFPAVRCLAYVLLRRGKVKCTLQLLAEFNTFPANVVGAI